MGPVGECVAETSAGADAELGEHLVQVVLGRAGADEKLRADLGVGAALGGEPGDPRLLGGEYLAGFDRALADRLAGGQQLAPGTLCEGAGPDPGPSAIRRATRC